MWGGSIIKAQKMEPPKLEKYLCASTKKGGSDD